MARSSTPILSYAALAFLLLAQALTQPTPDSTLKTPSPSSSVVHSDVTKNILPSVIDSPHTLAILSSDNCTTATLSHLPLTSTPSITLHSTTKTTSALPKSTVVSASDSTGVTTTTPRTTSSFTGLPTGVITGGGKPALTTGDGVSTIGSKGGDDEVSRIAQPQNCDPAVAKRYDVTCGPTVIGSSTSATWSCQTSSSTIYGCQITDTTTTTTVIPTNDPLCSASGCLECTATARPSPTRQCSDCTTINGVVYHSQQTTLSVPPKNTPPSRRAEAKSTDSSCQPLEKRKLPFVAEYGYDYDAFFAAQLAAPGMIMVPHRLVRQAEGMSTASGILKKFSDTPGQKVFMSVQGIAGCTSIIVVSKQAVYMNHIWEAPTFARGAIWQREGRDGIVDVLSTDAVFSAQINAIDYGDETLMSGGTPWDGQLPWLPSLRAQINGVFDPNQDHGVKAYMITPGPHDVPNPRVSKYPNRVHHLKQWLDDAFHTNTLVQVYERPRAEDAVDPNKAAGKVLFMFDPAQEGIPSRRMGLGGVPLSCTTIYSGWELWLGFQPPDDRENAWRSDFWFQPGGYFELPIWDPMGPGHLGMPMARRDDIPTNCVVQIASSVTPTTLSTVTGAHITSCALSTAKPYTLSGVGHPAATICSCNGNVIAGISKVYAGNGNYNLQCAVQASSSIIVSTFASAAPTTTGPITSCALSTAPPSMLNGKSQPASRVCSCNGGVITSINPVSIGYNPILVDISYRLQCAVPSQTFVVGTEIVGTAFNPLTVPPGDGKKRAAATATITAP